MSFSTTPRQALLLFALLARHGESLQANLVPAVAKADRDALVGAKLVETAKVRRGLQLKLTDDGWAWAGANLRRALPPAQGALHDLLCRLNDHLARGGETLADFIGSVPAQVVTKPGPAAPAPRGRRAPAGKAPGAMVGAAPRSAKPPTPAALRKRIEAAYLELTDGRKDEAVRLAEIRRRLGDLDREAVDAALARILKGDRKASLMRHDDPRQIGGADRDAAFNPAGEPFHLLWIAS